jgi:hypothetical protein
MMKRITGELRGEIPRAGQDQHRGAAAAPTR